MAPKGDVGAPSGEKGASKEKFGPNGAGRSTKRKPIGFTSHGVTDNDIFMLPSSDLQMLGVVTLAAALVRLFRIYQPSSVVFDEVQ